jgi:hypothetical protein
MRKLIFVVVALVQGLTGPLAMAQGIAADTASHLAPQGARLDLTKAFHTSTAWQLVVTEGPPTEDYGGNEAPGALTLCLHKGVSGPCISEPVTPLLQKVPPEYPAWEPHYLLAAKVVYPRGPGDAPFLLITTGSLHSGDGGQAVATQLVAYDAGKDLFRRVYEKTTGHNNNQEVRFITKGPLQGSVITAEPQEHLPYGYWIVVNSLTSAGTYRQVLRYRSATIYNDGNPLAVIDSEMPNIERRLGLWKLGQPIPTPNLSGDGKPCLLPTLRHNELWCGRPKG